MTDNILSQGRLAKNKSIMTTYNSIHNVYCIAFAHTTFRVEMANDSIYSLSKDQVQKSLARVNNIDNHVKIDVTKVFSKEQLVRANEVRRLPLLLNTNQIIKIRFNNSHATNCTRCPLVSPGLRRLSMLLSWQD